MKIEEKEEKREEFHASLISRLTFRPTGPFRVRDRPMHENLTGQGRSFRLACMEFVDFNDAWATGHVETR